MMKGFLIHISLLIVVLLTALFCFETVYNHVFQNGIPRNKRQNTLKYSNTNHDIVLLGSSRTESHIDDVYFSEVTGLDIINAGVERSSLQDAYIVTHRLVKNKVSFNELWVQLDYTYNTTHNSRNYFAEIIPYQDDPIIYKHLVETGMKNTYEVPFYDYMNNEKAVGFREFFMQLIKKPTRNDISLSSVTYDGTGVYEGGKWPEVLKPNLGLEKILKLSKEKGFKVVFFTTPNCPRSENRDAYMQLLKVKYDFVDYTRLFDDQLEYYRDCGHLNTLGRDTFTKHLVANFFKPKK